MSLNLLEPWDSNTSRAVRRALVKWYEQQRRSLPWRETRDPYRIWISEIMLQQTTVKAVIPYYERFLARFPTVELLAAATEAEVLQYWEGLGYYSRGRNLRLAAQVVCGIHAGSFPDDLTALQSLPGVGRYTAGAIRSFAFDLPAPIVEANTLRLYCRLLGYEGDSRSREGQQLLWEFAERLQPRQAAGVVNQGLMELGALLCTPVAPRCEACPVSRWCRAFAAGKQDEIPRKAARAKVTQVVEATVAVRRDGKLLIRQRGPEERWAGMWDFPRFPVESAAHEGKIELQAPLLREVAERFFELTALRITGEELATEFRHSVTRYRIRLLCLTAELMGKISLRDETLRWVNPSELAELPMPVTGRKFAETLRQRLL
ncbi:A/G-specific adenine glycosylase [Planctomicrobium sp. SH664]|uniref:A/G-specific adenine glycosylase n=1 Tax=Planctomicrobium sp. SH664 TaxID=3448125 RepID=UPI003F5B6BE5